MKRFDIISAAAILFASTAVYADPMPTAATPVPGQPVSNVKKANDPKEVICKTTETTGSRLGNSKTCLTRREWADIARESGDYTAQRQTQSLRNGPVSGP